MDQGENWNMKDEDFRILECYGQTFTYHKYLPID